MLWKWLQQVCRTKIAQWPYPKHQNSKYIPIAKINILLSLLQIEKPCISTMDLNSDGTHSVQKIHWCKCIWAVFLKTIVSLSLHLRLIEYNGAMINLCLRCFWETQPWMVVHFTSSKTVKVIATSFFFLETQLCGHVQMELVYSTAYHSYQSWSVLEVIWNNYFRPQILNKT